ncbi:MAG: PDGLE domain-containing protein [Candidatus Omnitrophica bacterium]|nr:PDGLE domain-containing protein [Candidatus Omnitrophota bacterium]
MNKKEILIGLFIALVLAFVLSPFASPWPDGLEKVAEDKGFIAKADIKPVLESPLPDYVWPGLRSEKLATSFAGIFGTLLIFGIGYGLAGLFRYFFKT